MSGAWLQKVFEEGRRRGMSDEEIAAAIEAYIEETVRRRSDPLGLGLSAGDTALLAGLLGFWIGQDS